MSKFYLIFIITLALIAIIVNPSLTMPFENLNERAGGNYKLIYKLKIEEYIIK
ncbi:hypothetical protein C2G38_2178073 [Gigaspora rosea]|uniref:Uncharacterized protein n=1 Tax=Gigaspora rosea TaxID=44941 RepID=A0A397VIT1_9GLOM|nr:hypothetical protein C2G38_2178073 [Gigaspora rosea]